MHRPLSLQNEGNTDAWKKMDGTEWLVEEKQFWSGNGDDG